jgi:colanic acid/amylovoran biosynthesis glycosyltransferase
MQGGAADRLPVAHAIECYLGLTETFIQEYLEAFRRVRPVIVARRREHQDVHPLPAEASLHLPPRRGTAAWTIAALRRRARGGDPHLEWVLGAEGVRLIHAHYGPMACQLLDPVERTGLPLVTSFYGYDASMKEVVAGLGERYRRLFRLGSVFLVEGPAMKARLERLGCPPEKLKIQRIAIDPERYRFRPREAPSEGPVILLQCGRMVAKKDYPTALRALALARRQDPRLCLRLLGDGPERTAVEELTRELQLEGAVTSLGARPRADFIEELDRAHVYLQPSRSAPDGDTEGGAPTTLLEAQAAGLPVLGTRHADIPYVVREGESALLCEEGDVGALAGNMIALAAEAHRWPAMGRSGRAWIEERHHVRTLTRQLEDLYMEIAREELSRSGGTS